MISSTSSQQRLLWRHHLGNIFGSIHCAKSCFPSLTQQRHRMDLVEEYPILLSRQFNSNHKSTGKSKILAIMNFDQASTFCAADSGDVPGVFSTALLLKGKKSEEVNNLGYFPNKFTMKPIDWISVATSSTSSQSRFYEFLEMLDDFSSNSEQTTRICPMKMVEDDNNNIAKNQQESGSSSSVSSNRKEWTSTQLLQWRIRSLTLATNLALHRSTSPKNKTHASTLPSWKWILDLLERNEKTEMRKQIAGGIQQQKQDDERLLREIYAEFLAMDGDIFSSRSSTANGNNNFFMILPALDDLIFAWRIVQDFGFCVSVETANNNNSGTSLFPTLAPLISSHLIIPKKHEISNMNSGISGKKSWSGFKVQNAKVFSDSSPHMQRCPQEHVGVRLLSQKQLEELMSSTNQDTKEMNYIGTKFMSSYYSLPSAASKNKVGIISSAEKWYLIVEKCGGGDDCGSKETQLVWD